MTKHLRSALAGLLALLTASSAVAQTFPTVPYHTVIGRLGAPGDTGPSQAIPFANLLSAMGVPSSIRPRILSTTFYVSPTGNDSGACTGTSTAACLTLNGVVAKIRAYDLNFQAITVNVATGTYAGMACLNPWVGYGSVTFIGDTTTPTNVLVAGGSSPAFDVENGCSVLLKGFSVSSTGSQVVQAVLGGRIVMSKMDLAATPAGAATVYSTRAGSYLEIADTNGATTIHTGAAGAYLLQATHNGELRINCTTACLSFSADVTYSAYTAMAQAGAIIGTSAASFALNGRTVTANKYQSQSGGVIQWNGNSPPNDTDIPGTAGTGVVLRGSAAPGPTVNTTGGPGAATSFLLLPGGTSGACFQKQDNSLNTFCIDNSGVPSFPLAPVPVASGGTNATTAAAARTSLGVTATGADTTYNFRANNLSDIANAATARSNLGLTAAAIAAAGQLPATATNDNATAGNLGEYVEARCQGTGTTATVTITIASPGVITWAANPFSGTAPRFDLCPVVFTTTGALPTGLTAGTAVYIIPSTISGNNFSVASSVINAIAGTAINTSGSQSGTHTGTAGLPLSTGATVNLAALSLTAGDWDVWGFDLFTGGATTNIQVLTSALTTTSVSVTATPGYYSNWFTNGNVPFATIVNFSGFSIGPSRFSLSATTTIFYTLNPVFTTSTLNGYAAMRARRVR